LEKISQVINYECPLWNKVLACEVLKAVCQNQNVFRLLYDELEAYKNTVSQQQSTSSSNNDNILIDLVSSVSVCVQKLLRENQQSVLSLQQHMKKEHRLENLLEKEAFHTSPDECITLCLECLMTIVSSMSVLAGVHRANNGTHHAQDEMTEQETQDLEQYRNLSAYMVENAWCPILAAVSVLLDRSEEEEIIQHILRTYLLFTHTCGVTGLTTPRDAFLTSLCKFTPQVSGGNLVSPINRKNVLVIKILFNFAHCLGGLLGSSWYLLLKNFQMFESIMTRDNFKGDLEDDLKILNAALNNLFKSTEDLDSDSLEIVLKALCSLSKDTLKNASSSEIPRLFGASKLVEIVQINAKRVASIWGYFSAHILFLVEHNDEDVRKFGVDSVTNVSLSIIRPEYNTYTDEQTVVDSVLEQNIFSIFALLFASKHKDVRERVLHSINNLVHKCGQVMSGSWGIIMRILTSCCEEPEPNSEKQAIDPKYIPIAFKGVQHIGKEFLQSLSHDFLLEYIETVGAFANQTRASDINISLVAVGLFMGIADYIAAEQNKTELWIKLFTQLVKSTADSRPEVRHASLRTLTFIMTSCGDKFSDECWDACVQQVLVQVLHTINDEAARAELVTAETPTSSDATPTETKKKQIIVHHSRNTAAKQFSETRSLAIESVSRIIKEHGSKYLKEIPSFESLCTELMTFIYQSILTKSAEIYKSSTRYVQEVLMVAEEPALSIIWKGAWDIWNTYADCAVSREPVESNTITFLIEGLIELYKARREIFSQEDIKQLLQLNHRFLLCPAANDVIVHPSAIQKTCLSFVREIYSYSEATYELVFDDLSSILPTREQIQQQLEMQEKERVYNNTNLPPPKALQPPVKLAIAVQKDLVELCCLNAPESVRKRLFHRLVNVLGTMMLTKYVVFTRPDPTSKSMARGKPPFFYPLWKHTIKLFGSVISSSLEHFDIEENTETVNSMWRDFCLAIETFLFPSEHDLGDFDEKSDDEDSESESDDDVGGRENEEILLINQIEKHALPHCISASGDIKKRILSILERTTHTAPKPVASEAMKCLFRLIKEASDACDKQETEESNWEHSDHIVEIGQFLIPMVVERSSEILRNFLKEDLRTGLMPLPRYRKEEVLNVLSELKSAQVHSKLYSKCKYNTSKEDVFLKTSLCGQNGLILRLFPILCEYVTSNDAAIKTALLDMFRIVSSELALTQVAEEERSHQSPSTDL
jgi:hypothetical protein